MNLLTFNPSSMGIVSSNYPLKYFLQWQYDRPSEGHHETVVDGWILDLKQANRELLVLESVIVTCSRIADEHFDDPAYNKITYTEIISWVEEEARRRHTNRYMSVEDTHEILKANEASFVAGNNTSEEQNRRFIGSLEDGVFLAETYAHYPDIINLLKEDFKYNDDDEGKRKKKKDFEANWPTELIRRLSPRTMANVERVYAMPEPFNHWDSRNSWQQYFFWRTLYGSAYVQGGSGSSMQREYHGRFAHAFAFARKIHDIKIPTTWLHYDEHNRFSIKRAWPDLKVMREELSGNYQVDLKDTLSLFAGCLMRFDWKSREIYEADSELREDDSEY